MPTARVRRVIAIPCRVCGANLTAPADRKLGRCATCPSTMDEELYGRLREWRIAAAAAQGVPAYVVFTDATLIALAERRPTVGGGSDRHRRDRAAQAEPVRRRGARTRGGRPSGRSRRRRPRPNRHKKVRQRPRKLVCPAAGWGLSLHSPARKRWASLTVRMIKYARRPEGDGLKGREAVTTVATTFLELATVDAGCCLRAVRPRHCRPGVCPGPAGCSDPGPYRAHVRPPGQRWRHEDQQLHGHHRRRYGRRCDQSSLIPMNVAAARVQKVQGDKVKGGDARGIPPRGRPV